MTRARSQLVAWNVGTKSWPVHTSIYKYLVSGRYVFAFWTNAWVYTVYVYIYINMMHKPYTTNKSAWLWLVLVSDGTYYEKASQGASSRVLDVYQCRQNQEALSQQSQAGCYNFQQACGQCNLTLHLLYQPSSHLIHQMVLPISIIQCGPPVPLWIASDSQGSNPEFSFPNSHVVFVDYALSFVFLVPIQTCLGPIFTHTHTQNLKVDGIPVDENIQALWCNNPGILKWLKMVWIQSSNDLPDLSLWVYSQSIPVLSANVG